MSEQTLLEILEAHFGKVKKKGLYAYIKSPFNDEDDNPSCAVLLEDSEKFTEGFFKDFSTGKSGNIYKLLGIEHNYGMSSRKKKLPTLESPTVPKFHMSRFQYKPSPYLYSRGISYEVQEEFKVYEKDDRVSMPVFDKDGYFIYDVSRLIHEKGYANSVPTDAIPAFTHAFGQSDDVFVCESMIDAYTLFTVGLKSIALNGAANHGGLPALFKNHFGKIILTLDPDKAGRKNAVEIMEKLDGKDIVNLDLPYDVNKCWTRMLRVLDFDTASKKFKRYLGRLIKQQ